jgi:hypothetical protein
MAVASDCVWMRGWSLSVARLRRCAYFFALAMRALMSASVQWWFWRALRSSYFRWRKDCEGALELVSASDCL